jgi:hypothetical protein
MCPVALRLESPAASPPSPFPISAFRRFHSSPWSVVSSRLSVLRGPTSAFPISAFPLAPPALNSQPSTINCFVGGDPAFRIPHSELLRALRFQLFLFNVSALPPWSRSPVVYGPWSHFRFQLSVFPISAFTLAPLASRPRRTQTHASAGHYDAVMRRQVAAHLGRMDCSVERLEKISLKLIRATKTTLPTVDALYEAVCEGTDLGLSPQRFGTLMRLLAACGGIQIVRRHVFLPAR